MTYTFVPENLFGQNLETTKAKLYKQVFDDSFFVFDLRDIIKPGDFIEYGSTIGEPTIYNCFHVGTGIVKQVYKYFAIVSIGVIDETANFFDIISINGEKTGINPFDIDGDRKPVVNLAMYDEIHKVGA